MAVAAGAFGAHGVADPQSKAWLQTGGEYQMIHALAVFAALGLPRAPARAAAWLFLAGSFVFSGTLYLMALGGPRLLGAVTPVGGVCMILGWAALAWAAFRGAGNTPA
jgi:uncharacterized membrane protein YgdD (TMEM256/DUF423 family)